MKMNNIEIRDVPYGPAGFGHEICVRDEAGDWVRILMSDDEAEAVAKHLAKMVNVHRGGGLCDEVGFVYWRQDAPDPDAQDEVLICVAGDEKYEPHVRTNIVTEICGPRGWVGTFEDYGLSDLTAWAEFPEPPGLERIRLEEEEDEEE